jgi:tetratricopeptide (TPR) repeat protein
MSSDDLTRSVSESGVFECDGQEAGSTQAVTGRSRLLVLAGCIAAVLALPAYLVVTHPLSAASATANSPSAAASSVAALEEEVHRSQSVDAKINLSLAYINGGASNRAIPLLLSVVANDSKNVVAWNNLCVANTLQRSYDLAIRACQNAIAIAPNFQLARNNLAWAQSEQAHAARR